MPDISRLVYTSDSGTVLPEMQWHEEIAISRDKATLKRSGKTADTIVNAGVWEVELDAQKTAALFKQIKSVNCAQIKRIEPQDIPDGGGSQGYTIVYTNSKRCSLLYDPGVTYTNAENITRPVNEFIQSLALPAGAQRYLADK